MSSVRVHSSREVKGQGASASTDEISRVMGRATCHSTGIAGILQWDCHHWPLYWHPCHSPSTTKENLTALPLRLSCSLAPFSQAFFTLSHPSLLTPPPHCSPIPVSLPPELNTLVWRGLCKTLTHGNDGEETKRGSWGDDR
ncbi:unnamed protein product [Pleuronectes platessa]|uniref:Uncharacterized protein n=1 Tax=Pleuronectes platessa TaxID=8262 RepID=A0A9N7YMB2_PLEPL|nr:unnamed protein product [Pleuronectes platessa]